MAQEMLTSLGPFRSREPVLLLLFPSSESRVPAFSTVVAENETLTKTGLGFKTPLGPKTRTTIIGLPIDRPVDLSLNPCTAHFPQNGYDILTHPEVISRASVR
jgi:hypothetical protein